MQRNEQRGNKTERKYSGKKRGHDSGKPWDEGDAVYRDGRQKGGYNFIKVQPRRCCVHIVPSLCLWERINRI